jgi:hypothetical protein
MTSGFLAPIEPAAKRRNMHSLGRQPQEKGAGNTISREAATDS